MIAALALCAAWTEQQQTTTKGDVPEVDLIETPTPDALTVYTDIPPPSIKIRPRVEINGKTLDLAANSGHYSFWFEWTAPKTFVKYREDIDPQTLVFFGYVDGRLGYVDERRQDLQYEFRVHAQRKTAADAILPPDFRSKPVAIKVTTRYTVDVSPRSAAPSAGVEVRLTPTPAPFILSTAKVFFGPTPSEVKVRSGSVLRVVVPDIRSGSHPDVLVNLGTDLPLTTESFEGFTVEGPGINAPTVLALVVLLGFVASLCSVLYLLYTRQKGRQAGSGRESMSIEERAGDLASSSHEQPPSGQSLAERGTRPSTRTEPDRWAGQTIGREPRDLSHQDPGADSATVPKRGKDKKLYDFLKTSFEPVEFHKFLTFQGGEFVDVAEAVNPDNAAGDYFFEVVAALQRRGLIDGSFFEQLRNERPRFGAQISALQKLWREDD
jgi:hypothetical protein